MFTFDNTHIFTGYIKQLLASIPLPTCRIYTKEFIQYKALHGTEDPRVLATTTLLGKHRPGAHVSYVKDNGIYQYRWGCAKLPEDVNASSSWNKVVPNIFEDDKYIVNFTKVLKTSGGLYDAATHEYLGEYLRFLRDYHGVNLMSLYNCFNNQIYNNVYCHIPAPSTIFVEDQNDVQKLIQKTISSDILFSSYDPKYKIYAFPVKLFERYTIAIDSAHGFEMCCGFYKTAFDDSKRGIDLVKRTYQKVRHSVFNQPFIYDKLAVEHWTAEQELKTISTNNEIALLDENTISRLDIAEREADLKLFIKIPTSCVSSITVLEGDFRNFNDCRYIPNKHTIYTKNGQEKDLVLWNYSQNHYIVNTKPVNKASLNVTPFKPISKVQLLAFNTGISYPFADRLVEYLVGSAITPMDEIADNVKRAQKVMNSNGIYFEMDGIWENKMQKLIYDQLMVAGPFEKMSIQKPVKPTEPITEPIVPAELSDITIDYVVDKRQGIHPKLGHTKRSTLYDILGYVDRHAEKFYGSWIFKDGKMRPKETIQDVDIYNGLFDIN